MNKPSVTIAIDRHARMHQQAPSALASAPQTVQALGRFQTVAVDCRGILNCQYKILLTTPIHRTFIMRFKNMLHLDPRIRQHSIRRLLLRRMRKNRRQRSPRPAHPAPAHLDHASAHPTIGITAAVIFPTRPVDNLIRDRIRPAQSAAGKRAQLLAPA